MPVHDWTKVTAGTFHHFHHAWITAISESLNGGLLPDGNYAMAEQVAGLPHPDVIALEEHTGASGWTPCDGKQEGGVAVDEHPPQVRFTLEAEESIYAAKANRIAIYHTSGDRVVAFIEIVSPGNKNNLLKLTHLLEMLAGALADGRHLLVIDLHPPGRHDPEGIHAAFWGTTPGVTEDYPLSLSVYRADYNPNAYFEPITVGQVLPEMPLFLTPARYINVPLEETYLAAWRGVPQRWKNVVEAEW